MSKIRLDDIEAKAKDCTSWDWFHDGSQLAIECDHDYSHLMDEEVRFIASMTPKTALALIRAARAARDYYFAPYCDDHECGCHEAHHEDLKEALKEIEP